jgi:hypothetical protein
MGKSVAPVQVRSRPTPARARSRPRCTARHRRPRRRARVRSEPRRPDQSQPRSRRPSLRPSDQTRRTGSEETGSSQFSRAASRAQTSAPWLERPSQHRPASDVDDLSLSLINERPHLIRRIQVSATGCRGVFGQQKGSKRPKSSLRNCAQIRRRKPAEPHQ